MTTICAVADTGPLIHLEEANALELFSEFDELLVPETVYEELEDGGLPQSIDEIAFTRTAVDFRDTDYPQLDPGETAAITLCKDVHAVLLTDDMAARETASDHGLEVHGSIGIILLAYSRNSIGADKAKELIRGLKRETSLYLADPIVEYGLRLVDQNDSKW